MVSDLDGPGGAAVWGETSVDTSVPSSVRDEVHHTQTPWLGLLTRNGSCLKPRVAQYLTYCWSRRYSLLALHNSQSVPKPLPEKHLTKRSFAVAKVQMTVFTPDEEVSAVKLVALLGKAWHARFDQEPTVQPPGLLPPDVPRLLWGSSSGSYACEIASSRLNLYWARTKQSEHPPSDLVSAFVELLIDYKTVVNARVARLAFVLTRYVLVDNPGHFLANHFCKDRWARAPFNRPESFELHAHKVYQLPTGLAVNSWVRNRTGKASGDPIVLLEQDLNTLSEEVNSAAFSDAEIKGFFEACPAEADAILSLYYPEVIA